MSVTGGGEYGPGRLAALRGPVEPIDHNARTIAALAANPGCDRRAVLDAAGVDKGRTIRHLGHPPRFGLSPFAMFRNEQFKAIVKDDDGARLAGLLREVLHLTTAETAYQTTGEEAGASREVRHRRTADLLRDAAQAGRAATLLDRPLLKLAVAGHDVYLEPDVIAFQAEGRFHIVAIKAFAVIDGQAETAKVSAAAREAAVYVHAMRALFADLGLDPERVSHDVVLVCPKDFGNVPTATLVDVRHQLLVLDRQLGRLKGVDRILAALPADLTFDLGRPAAEVAAALSAVGARYAPECLAACEMAAFCRAEAHACDSLAALGRSVRDDFGGVGSVAGAIGLAEGAVLPEDDQSEVAERLRHIHRIYDEAVV
ncbi:hypothetical protein C1I98_06655 [Spongiactinospora gelatinilytica]|uniref:Secreted protein n=1 Tax=Spongiactinospora gelatinilytica TaxID=2666298 RepID=A0A2W2HQP9_9ACTN|nr:hypothetical protein [Spongiactinospora gelatinilytica]PZG52850.1 hypothetical protein C1I98_06655 [Spongiactinospora gelatinilytica]